jgi:cation-transporting ATPase 13A1
MIEFSSEKVSGNTFEAFMLVLFLLMFALSASGYVLMKGLEQEKDHFGLLLHCILIITSVIPPELNMQLALAVNASLLALMRLHVFCTEPFRIPLAGKISVCLFDKTGTITTDELVAAGYVAPPSNAETTKTKDSFDPYTLDPMLQCPIEAAVVMGGCHSLVSVEGKVTGDPLETAALKTIQWGLDAETGVCMPDTPVTGRPWSTRPAVKIVHRHHFSSTLQRMSTVCEVKMADRETPQLWGLVKGMSVSLCRTRQ